MEEDFFDDGFLEGLREEFYADAVETLVDCENLLLTKYEEGLTPDDTKEYKRILHSLKGSAHAVELVQINDILHTMEDLIIDNIVTQEITDKHLLYIDKIREFIALTQKGDQVRANQIINDIN